MKLNCSEVHQIIEDGAGRDVTREQAKERGLKLVDEHIVVVAQVTLAAETPEDHMVLAELHKDIVQWLNDRGYEMGDRTGVPAVYWGPDMGEDGGYIC